MAPIHHHFEKLGLKETKVVIRFWIVTILLALLGIGLLGINVAINKKNINKNQIIQKHTIKK